MPGELRRVFACARCPSALNTHCCTLAVAAGACTCTGSEGMVPTLVYTWRWGSPLERKCEYCVKRGARAPTFSQNARVWRTVCRRGRRLSHLRGGAA
eukprot:3467797-Prymnesium_polylepis.1